MAAAGLQSADYDCEAACASLPPMPNHNNRTQLAYVSNIMTETWHIFCLYAEDVPVSPEPAVELQSADADSAAASQSPLPTPQENTTRPAARVRP